MSNEKNSQAPVELGDQALEQANGGLGLLVPAVQKVREATTRPTGGFNVLLGDGSVRVADGSVKLATDG